MRALFRLIGGDETLDVKPLRGHPLYRLRVGDFRVIFEMIEDGEESEVLIHHVLSIGPRGDAYKGL